VVAVIAAWIGLKTFKSQRTVSDIQLAISIFNEINRYWDRIGDGIGTYQFNMGQILAHCEIGADLFNRNALTKDASGFLGDHIVEIFTMIRSSPEGRALIDQCCSSPTTFEQLQKFVRDRMPQALSALDFSRQRAEGIAF